MKHWLRLLILAGTLLGVFNLSLIVSAQDKINADAVAQNWIDVWNNPEYTPEQLEDFFTPQIKTHYQNQVNSLGKAGDNIPQFKRLFNFLHRSTSGFNYTAQNVTAVSDDVVMFDFNGVGTVTGLDTEVTIEGRVILRLEGNKIAENWILSSGYVTHPQDVVDGSPLVFGNSVRGELEVGQRVRHPLTVTEPKDSFSIRMTTTCEGVLRIYTEAGSMLRKEDSVYGEGKTEILRDLSLEADTTLLVEVSCALDSNVSDYTLRVR